MQNDLVKIYKTSYDRELVRFSFIDDKRQEARELGTYSCGNYKDNGAAISLEENLIQEIREKANEPELFRATYFNLPPLSELYIHSDKNEISRIKILYAIILPITTCKFLKLNYFSPTDISKINVFEGPEGPTTSVPMLDKNDALLTHSFDLDNNLVINIDEFHSVKNNSSTVTEEFLSLRFLKYYKKY
jgi:hypothetical protein